MAQGTSTPEQARRWISGLVETNGFGPEEAARRLAKARALAERHGLVQHYPALWTAAERAQFAQPRPEPRAHRASARSAAARQQEYAKYKIMVCYAYAGEEELHRQWVRTNEALATALTAVVLLTTGLLCWFGGLWWLLFGLLGVRLSAHLRQRLRAKAVAWVNPYQSLLDALR